MHESTELARKLSIAEIMDIVTTAKADMLRACRVIDEAEKRINDALSQHSDSRTLTLRDPHSSCRPLNWADPSEAIAKLDTAIWERLVDHLEMRRVLSMERAKELDAQLDRGDMPELTLENVVALATGFRSQMSEMLNESVSEVFNWLRPPMSRYKTNSEWEVPQKVVLSWIVEQGIKGLHVRYDASKNQISTSQRLRALENVFMHLDGRAAVNPTHNSQLQNLIDAGQTSGETEYFKFRVYSNSNMHLTFKRADLLAKLNATAGGNRLRGNRAWKPRAV